MIQKIREKIIGRTRYRYEVLAELINKHEYKSYCEVGVFDGRTIKYLIEHCPSLKTIYGVDNYNNSEYEEQTPLNKMNQPKLTNAYHKAHAILGKNLLKSSSEKGAEYFEKHGINFDIVFIDADHSYKAVLKDIAFWKPLINKGGILAGHDYTTYRPQVMKAVNESFDIDEVKVSEDYVWSVFVNG